MPQGVLHFQYQVESAGKGLTALSGLGIYLDFLYGIGIPGKADEAIGPLPALFVQGPRECGLIPIRSSILLQRQRSWGSASHNLDH